VWGVGGEGGGRLRVSVSDLSPTSKSKHGKLVVITTAS
jgi:hypothetical protein